MSDQRIKPAKKIVLITPDKPAKRGLIDVPDKTTPETGRVVAIGEGKLPIEMKIGDIISYRKYGGSDFYLGTEKFLFVSFDDVLGVIR